MRRDARVLLTDIDQAGADIQLFTDGMDSTAYAADARTQAAVERKFEIIGEAVNRLHADHPELASKIPDMLRIIDFRNDNYFFVQGVTISPLGEVDSGYSSIIWLIRFSRVNFPKPAICFCRDL